MTPPQRLVMKFAKKRDVAIAWCDLQPFSTQVIDHTAVLQHTLSGFQMSMSLVEKNYTYIIKLSHGETGYMSVFV